MGRGLAPDFDSKYGRIEATVRRCKQLDGTRRIYTVSQKNRTPVTF